ncbi:hypothetical protein [Pseudogemmobacter blasticus]|uniref:Uncharacterized protein n=1 Tax=Fuscovulum blasticum DSM 2131 TaxID=1188250 RepID=A0A2T4JDT2_FUSBL|nr:hypothetical protein [Fuscovulum blasticum]PTE15988.1 hypothetical protein C5F44_02825 [Fuscovulum blasticum DSM 2131]
MNLSEVSNIAEDQDRGRWLDLLSPYDGKPVGIRLLIAGPDSMVQARARLKLADELADMADDEGRVSAENRETARLRNLARCVLAWDATEDGKAVPFSFEGALRLLRAGRWVQEQVDDFAGSRRAFAKGAA